MVTIYHNGRCSKSRGALEMLQEAGVPHQIRWYLAEPLSAEELDGLLKKLGMQPSALVRKGEAYFKDQLRGKILSEQEWKAEILTHPELMERPIVVNGDRAVVARPPERLREIL